MIWRFKTFWEMSDPDLNILLFDGICNLCNGSVNFIIKHDKNNRIKFASLQSESGQRLLIKLGFSINDIKSVVLIQGNEINTKSTAVLKLLRILGPPWSFLYVFVVIPRFLRDLVYDAVANSRYKLFGKRDECMIPTSELKEKFL